MKPEFVYRNTRWNLRVGLINSSFTLLLPLLTLGFTPPDRWGAVESSLLLAGALAFAALLWRHMSIHVVVRNQYIVVRNPIIRYRIRKCDIVLIEAKGLYGVACAQARLRQTGPFLKKKITILALPFTDAVVLEVDAPMSWD